jgi:hypothetical protein
MLDELLTQVASYKLLVDEGKGEGGKGKGVSISPFALSPFPKDRLSV